jgi:hypothetical protein
MAQYRGRSTFIDVIIIGRMKTRVLIIPVILAVIITVPLVRVARSEALFTPYPDIDTVYVDGSTKADLLRVRPGMTKGQVLRLLGQPFRPLLNSGAWECWPYSRDGRIWPIADFAWVFVRVCFVENRVAGVYSDVITD